MKSILAAGLVLTGLLSTASYACQNGDTSKTLLVIAATPDGEERAVIGEIETADGSVQLRRQSYMLVSADGEWITVKSFGGDVYKFNRSHAREAGFCYKAIFAE